MNSDSAGKGEPNAQPESPHSGDDEPTRTTSPRKREWAALPHPLALVLTFASVLTGLASCFTAWFNYQEARRNNRQPPEPTLSAFLIRPPEGTDVGELELVIRNDGKTPATSLRCKRALGVGIRPSYNRSWSDPIVLDALLAANFHGERQAALQSMPAIVAGQTGYHDHAATVDFLGAGQTATVRSKGIS